MQSKTNLRIIGWQRLSVPAGPLENQTSLQSINRDRRETGKQTVAQQAGLAGEDGPLMQPRWNLLKLVLSNPYIRFSLQNRNFGQPDRDLASALV